MSTLVTPSRARLIKKIALASVAVVFAGCSQNTERFDPLFTKSVKPQRISAPYSVQQNRTSTIITPRGVPQRLDRPSNSIRVNDPFAARNINKVAKANNYGVVPQQSFTPRTSDVLRPQYTPPLAAASKPLYQSPSLPSTVARQSLPPVVAPTKPKFPAGDRLTLEEARSINDTERAPTPLLARAPSAPSSSTLNQPLPTPLATAPVATAPVAAAPQFETGTDWTRLYSPVPTQSPRPKSSTSSYVASAQPKAYTPPSGFYTAKVDRTSTQSIARPYTAPRVIRSSVARDQIAAAANIDRRTTSSIRPQAAPAPLPTTTNGRYVKVRAGETLYSIARSNNVSVSALTRANNIVNANSLKAGQTLLIPGKTASAFPQRQTYAQRLPATVAPVSQRPVATAQGVHVVQPGETLYKIARRYGVSVASLQNQNGLSSANVIRVGQKLRVNGTASPAYNTSTAVAGLPRLDRTTTASTARKQAPVLPRSRPAYKPKVVTNTQSRKATPRSTTAYKPPVIDRTTTASTRPANASGKFSWPAQGQVISRFGDTRNGTRNDGIDIAAPVGSTVRSAAAGEVIYASNGLEGYGNLVLIRHPGNYVTAYAHNSSLAVRRGQRVRAGQVVARSGKNSVTGRPAVHFEVRKNKRPIDPMTKL